MKMDIKIVILLQLVVALLATRVTRSNLGSDGAKGLLPHKYINIHDDEIAEKYPPTSIPHLSRSYSGERVRDRRQAGGYLPFRVVVYFVTENITNSPTALPYLNDPAGPFQSAMNYFQSVLSVVRAPHNLIVPPYCAFTNNGQCTSIGTRMCGDFARVPDEHLGTITVCDPTCREVGGSNIGVDADYIFYVVSIDDDFCRRVGTAYANSCFLDDVTNRPLTGFTNICPQAFQRSRQSFFNLVVHEMLHAVGFTRYLFGFFIDEDGNQYNASTTLRINGADVLAINSPKVLSYGREYYSCPDLQGVLLENEGGPATSGSHWEARTLADEIMSVSLHEEFASISNFTLNLLEDSGWYKVDYMVAESLHNYELLWGKGLGCSFITAGCDTWPYSCTPGASGCSYDYQAASVCVTSGSDFLLDGCSYFIPYSNGACNAPGVPVTSSCFPRMSSSDGALTGRCYNHQCYRYLDLQKLFYTVTRSGSTKVCPSDGAVLTFSDGVMLTCPPVELTCSRRTPIFLLTSTTHIPSSWCHDTCATCSRPASPAHCLTCAVSLTLRGTAPSVCTTDNCGGGDFQESSGNCVACAAGCRACTGPNIVDCLACEDETLYRLTTNQVSSSVCVAAAECDDTAISAFGDRTCSLQRGGGANSIHYHQFSLLLLLLVCSLHL